MRGQRRRPLRRRDATAAGSLSQLSLTETHAVHQLDRDIAPSSFLMAPSPRSATRRRHENDGCASASRSRSASERLAAIDRDHAAAIAELADVEARRQQADGEHEGRVADWHIAGQTGPRPVSEAETLDTRITQLRDDLAAFARERVLQERVAYVAKHRKRLSRDAHQETDERFARCLALVDELEREDPPARGCQRSFVPRPRHATGAYAIR
jgi:hypothetical protein